MSQRFEQLGELQRLVTDMARVKREHRVPGTERRENVVEHSFGVALLAWRLHSLLELDLDLAKIMQYALVHDFPERGQAFDTNAFASTPERQAKLVREQEELSRLLTEFWFFSDLTEALDDYHGLKDEEARYVWTVDKIHAIVSDEVDGWRAHRAIPANHEEFVSHCAELLPHTSEHLRDLFVEIVEHAKTTYYDQPQ